jgi:hypothetical protein
LARKALARIDTHASAITDPLVMAAALDAAESAAMLAKRLEKWADGVRHAAVEMSRTAEVPGWARAEKRGARECQDMQAAYAVAQTFGIDAQAFVGCCKLSLPALEDAVATAYKTSGKGTKKDGAAALSLALGSVVTRGPERAEMQRK